MEHFFANWMNICGYWSPEMGKSGHCTSVWAQTLCVCVYVNLLERIWLYNLITATCFR